MRKLPVKRAKREAPEDRKELILRAARACLGKNGVKGFSLSSVASEAQVSISLLPHYFGSVDELLTATILFSINDARPGKIRRADSLDEALQSARTLVEQIFCGDNFSRENLLIWLSIYDGVLLDSGIRRSYRETQRRLNAHAAAVFSDIARFQDLSIDSDLLAEEFLAFIDGLKLRWCMSWRRDTVRERSAAICFLNERLGQIEVCTVTSTRRTSISPKEPAKGHRCG